MPRTRTESPAAAKARLRAEIQTEHAGKVIISMVDVATDSSASPQARAAAGNAVLRAGGFFEKLEGADDLDNPDYSKMEPEEISRLLAEAKSAYEERMHPILELEAQVVLMDDDPDDEDGQGNIFD